MRRVPWSRVYRRSARPSRGASHHYGGLNVVGLCHGVRHGHQQIARVLGLDYRDLEIVCAGINHQTWYARLLYNGVDYTDRLLEAMEQSDFVESEKVRIDLLRRFGGWAQGETGGYLRVCREWRHYFDAEYETWLAGPPLEYKEENRSLEHGSFLVEAAVTGDDELLRQAMMMDPLTGAVCSPPGIWQMVDEMLVAQKRWLPQYGPAIAAAEMAAEEARRNRPDEA